MKTMMQKLRNSRGETIGEVLVSLLIAALALMMLAAMITSAGKMVRESKENLKAYYTKIDTLTNQSGTGVGQKLVCKSSSDQEIKLYDADIMVNIYSSEAIGNKTVYSYKK